MSVVSVIPEVLEAASRDLRNLGEVIKEANVASLFTGDRCCGPRPR
jgi:hypothetical protein